MRDKEGRALANAHILGFLRRITKLLYYGIKPVFVFDGGAPVIKRATLAQRKKRKRGNADTLAKTAEKLLAAQMRQAAVAQAEKKQRLAYEGDYIDEDAVYLEDLPPGVPPRGAPEGSAPNHQPEASTSKSPPKTPAKKKKDYHKDQYALPALDEPMSSRAQLKDPRLATEDELRDFIEDLKPEDLDVDAEWFHGLSTQVQYEILGDLRLKSRQANFRRVEQMRQAATALDFSRAQIKHLMQRNDLTQKLLSVTDDISRAHIKIPIRIASERNKHYVLVKNDAKDGSGGWVLGVRDPVKPPPTQTSSPNTHKGKTVKIDVSDSDTEDSKSITDEGEFEEVYAPSGPKESPQETYARKRHAFEALQQRYSPSKSAQDDDDALPQLPVQEPLFSPSKRQKRHHIEEDLDQSLLAAAATDPTLFNDIANSHLGRPSKMNPIASSSDSHIESGPQRPSMGHQKSTTTNVRAALQPQELSSDEDSDQEMEEINPELSLSNQLSDEPLPPPRDISKPNSRHSRTSVTVDPNTIQKPAPPKTTARPLARRTPQQATLSAQAKLRNNTSFGEFTGISSPGTPDCQIQPSGSVSEDGSGDPEQPLDQGPSIISSALQLESDSEGELEEVQTERRGEVFTLPIQQPVEASSVQEHSHDPSPTDMSELHQTATQSSAFDILLQPTATGIPATKAASFSNEQTSAQPSRPQPSRSPKTVIPVEKHEKQAETLLDEDSDAVEDWSRSPSPAGRAEHQAKANEPPAMSSQEVHAPDYVPPDFPLAPEGKELDSDGDLDAGDLEEAELTANIRAEEGHFTKFLRDLQHRNLTNMRSEVDAEVAQLEQARKTDRRNADEITTQMSKEIMVMLRFFGIPFVVAPMEAEAQCAELASRSLVDGIITDDSDVFLFGGTRVYKNMFNQNKYVECYLLSDMDRELGLNRDKLVQLAHFLGSDYSDGLPGVGPVVGMELMNEFHGEDGLVEFRKWWQKVQSGKDSEKDTNSAFKRRFKKSKRDLFLDDYWPNPEIRKAYYNPSIDSSEERFRWGVPDLDGLRGFLAESLGWGVNKVDDLLTPLIKRMQQRAQGAANMQGSLDSFFDVSGGTGRFQPSKSNLGQQSQRMQNVIKSWKAKQSQFVAEQGDSSKEEASPPAQPKRRRRTLQKNSESIKSRPKRRTPTDRPGLVHQDGRVPQPDVSGPGVSVSRLRAARPRRASTKTPLFAPEDSDLEGDDGY